MASSRWAIVLVSLVLPSAAWSALSDNAVPTTAASVSASDASASGGMILAAPDASAADPCFLQEVTANPTRPNWDTSASTTQCGIVETDYGWATQPMGAGVNQWMLVTSMRYGLTPKLDLRWGLTNHISQSGGGTQAIQGAGDQWVNVRYRFLEQSKWLPALAFDYGVKIPTANPAKGFGSGFADNQFVLIASRDLGKNHFDFNMVGTEVGEAHGHDGAAQFGLALTRPVTTKLSAILESYGGPQPGTSNRFGAGFVGASYVLKPTIAVDCSYARTYTAGSPRQQVQVGMTYAMRPGFLPMPKGSSFARLLGR